MSGRAFRWLEHVVDGSRFTGCEIVEFGFEGGAEAVTIVERRKVFRRGILASTRLA